MGAGSVGGVGGTDFGCHFLRSEGGAIVVAVGDSVAVVVGIGAVSGMGTVSGFVSED